MSDTQLNKEQRILRMVKRVLTDIVKDTSTPPGLKHPLSEDTVKGIRDCLELITSRETELHEESGHTASDRPKVAGQPQSSVRVTLGKNKKD